MSEKFAVLLKTSDYRGDHSSEIFIGIDVTGEMTIAELMDIAFNTGIGKYKTKGNPPTDHIEIRILNAPS